MKNTPPRSDRRVRRTQKSIELAFAELMAVKDINSITVSELAEKADIHRATFYSHYSDIPELYTHIQRSVVEGLQSIVEPDPIHGPNQNGEEVFGMLVDYIYGRQNIFKMLLTRSSTREFYEELSKLFESLYADIYWSDLPDTVSKHDIRVMARYHVNGCISIISSWAQDDFKDSPEKIIYTLGVIDVHFDKLMHEITAPDSTFSQQL